MLAQPLFPCDVIFGSKTETFPAPEKVIYLYYASSQKQTGRKMQALP